MTTVEEWVKSTWNTPTLRYHFTDLRIEIQDEIINLVSKVLESKTIDEKIDFKDIQPGDTVYFIDKTDRNRVYINDYMEVDYTDGETLVSTDGARAQMRPYRVYYLVDRPDPKPELPAEPGTTIWNVTLTGGGFCPMLTRTPNGKWVGIYSSGVSLLVIDEHISSFSLEIPETF